MAELREILRIKGRATPFEDSKRALEQVGAIVHGTDEEVADTTFSPLVEHGVQQTGSAVLPRITTTAETPNIISQINSLPVKPPKIPTESTGSWNFAFLSRLKEKILNKRGKELPSAA